MKKSWRKCSALALLIVSAVLAVRKGTAFLPSMESTQASISVTMPEGSSLEETGEMTDEIMARLKDISDIEEMGAMAGGGHSIMNLVGGSSTDTSAIYLLRSGRKGST